MEQDRHFRSHDIVYELTLCTPGLRRIPAASIPHGEWESPLECKGLNIHHQIVLNHLQKAGFKKKFVFGCLMNWVWKTRWTETHVFDDAPKIKRAWLGNFDASTVQPRYGTLKLPLISNSAELFSWNQAGSKRCLWKPLDSVFQTKTTEVQYWWNHGSARKIGKHYR